MSSKKSHKRKTAESNEKEMKKVMKIDNLLEKEIGGKEKVTVVMRGGKQMYAVKCPDQSCGVQTSEIDTHLSSNIHRKPWKLEDARYFK